jgi:hypothetical protein
VLAVLDVEEGDVVRDERVETVDRHKLLGERVWNIIVVDIRAWNAGKNLGLVSKRPSKDVPELV